MQDVVPPACLVGRPLGSAMLLPLLGMCCQSGLAGGGQSLALAWPQAVLVGLHGRLSIDVPLSAGCRINATSSELAVAEPFSQPPSPILMGSVRAHPT